MQSLKENEQTINISLAGGVSITPARELPANMAIMLWGEGGMGKTTLACTAPGRKLIVNFDPRGPTSVSIRDDVQVADYSTARDITGEFKKTDPFGLSKTVGQFDTYIIDSLSSVQEQATRKGIEFVGGKASIERPSTGAYQARNALLLELVNNMLTFGEKHGKHVIFIAHEGAKDRNEEGSVIGIPIMLGGQLSTLVGVKLSEIWAIYETSNKKTIAIRPCRSRGPMKTRMFQTTVSPEFHWNYNPETDEGMTIEDWHTQWLVGGKKKLPLPK